MIKIIDNCCSPEYLNCMKHLAINAERWGLNYPLRDNSPFEEKLPKLGVINNGTLLEPMLAGLAIGLLIQILKACGRGFFIPEMVNCTIGIVDKHSKMPIHRDHHLKEQHGEENFVKILGLLNSDWEESWGGGFNYDGESNYIKPTSFCVFDPKELHATEEIFTDNKRFAIDLTVFKDEQSLQAALPTQAENKIQGQGAPRWVKKSIEPNNNNVWKSQTSRKDKNS